MTYADATQTSTTVSVGFTTGTDAGSGIGTRLLQRASATLTGTTCGTYGAFATVAGGTNPATSPVVDTVTAGICYKYQYVVSDNVGNAAHRHQRQRRQGDPSLRDPAPGQPRVRERRSHHPLERRVRHGDQRRNGRRSAPAPGRRSSAGNGTDITETVSRAVTIPANCSVSLTYWLRVTTTEFTHPFDYFKGSRSPAVATTTVQGATRTFRRGHLCTSSRTVDLSAYAGQAVTLTFGVRRGRQLSRPASGWDDVALTTGRHPRHFSGPTGGSVDAGGLVGTGGRYATSTALSINLAKGTDPSGVAATGNSSSAPPRP